MQARRWGKGVCVCSFRLSRHRLRVPSFLSQRPIFQDLSPLDDAVVITFSSSQTTPCTSNVSLWHKVADDPRNAETAEMSTWIKSKSVKFPCASGQLPFKYLFLLCDKSAEVLSPCKQCVMVTLSWLGELCLLRDCLGNGLFLKRFCQQEVGLS